MTKPFAWLLVCCAGMLSHHPTFAHNGSTTFAYPLGKITIDGQLSDWPAHVNKQQIGNVLSDTHPHNANDFSGFFQVGYRLADKSLYIAFTITDDDFIEDTTANVRWNTQDGLELAIDARHTPTGSGVASFMYSKKLRNINKAYFDSFAGKASWDIVEVAMTRKGNQRFYEWKIKLNEHLVVGHSVGLDFVAFDLDTDKTFTFNSWGKGESKYANPASLGDIILAPAKALQGAISGKVSWDQQTTTTLPGQVTLRSVDNKMFWIKTAVDSLGNYKTVVPAGTYDIDLGEPYFLSSDKIYGTGVIKPQQVVIKHGKETIVAPFIIPFKPAPDLLPDSGILLDFSAERAKQLDHFIETYQQYYQIPGVSLALIREGKVVYHKTYGVKNVTTGEPVNNMTLFEAASITKPVFAYAVQRLAERGTIDLDKPLYEYLPYDDIAHDDRYKLITARHVLTHRTGFPNWRSYNNDGKLDIKFTPGTGYGYSGEGFEYLKLVVQKITGKPVEQILKEEVIEPIGLYHTFFSRNDSLRSLVADGHFNRIANHDDLPDAPGMAYSMHTEALIFTNFMLHLLNQRGLSPETYENMFRKHSDYTLDPGDTKPLNPVYMGMSLEIRETPWGKTFGHGGNNGDFKCVFEVYKDQRMGYVVFTNSSTSDYLLQAMRKLLVEGKQEKKL